MKLTGREIFFKNKVKEETPFEGYEDHDSYQAGFGYGHRFGLNYCSSDGSGYGEGYPGDYLPYRYTFELIQYWE